MGHWILKAGLIPAALCFASMSARAHVVLAETQAIAGSYYAAFFRVSHACGDSPTLRLRVEVPASIASVAAQPKQGWKLSVEREGNRVRAIVWEGRLESDQFDQFGVMLKLPNTNGPLYLPTIQTCEKGENRWTDIPATGQPWNSVPHPAPVVNLTGGKEAIVEPEHHIHPE